MAANLRHLADDTREPDDHTLYLTAAEALEGRARLLAAAWPQQHGHESSKLRLHQPVNMSA